MRGASSAVTARPPAIVPESSPQETTRQACLLKEEATRWPHLSEKKRREKLWKAHNGEQTAQRALRWFARPASGSLFTKNIHHLHMMRDP